MSISDTIKGFGLRQLYGWLDKDPEKNIPKILDYLEKHDPAGISITAQAEAIRKALSDPNGNWAKLVKSL